MSLPLCTLNLTKRPTARASSESPAARNNIDKDEPDDFVRVGSSVEPGEQAAQRMGGQHVVPGTPAACSSACRSATGIRGGPRLDRRVASAHLRFLAVGDSDGSWPIVGADVSEAGDAGQNHGPRRLWLQKVVGPVPSGSAVTGFEDHTGTSPAPALQVQMPPTADIDQPGKVTAGRRYRRLNSSALAPAALTMRWPRMRTKTDRRRGT